ncbi:MAG: redoxin domain-containing protein [Ignavibacteriales bacterium]|nr:redoxin domain-containing protein [Ignavibacteriales bacterium]
MKKTMLLLALMCIALTLFAQAPDTTTLTKVGQAVPDFNVTTLDGKVLKIADLKGKVVLINFFATWCGPCMGEMPHVEKEIWQQLKNESLVVLAIGREHSKEELVKFNKEKGFTFLIAPDPKREIYSKFAKQFIPRNYVVGKDGMIVFQSMGYATEEFTKMVELIKSQLKPKV